MVNSFKNVQSSPRGKPLVCHIILAYQRFCNLLICCGIDTTRFCDCFLSDKKTGIPDRDPRKRDEEKSRLNFLFFYLSGLGLFRKPHDPLGQIARAKGFRMDPFIGHASFGKRSAHVVHEGCRTADVRVGIGRGRQRLDVLSSRTNADLHAGALDLLVDLVGLRDVDRYAGVLKLGGFDTS